MPPKKAEYPILPSLVYSQDGVDHVQAHLDAVPGVVVAGLGQPGDAVVAVAQDLDAHALVVLRQLVEPAKELVQCGHQLGGRQLFGEWREVYDVGVQDAVRK